MKRLQVLLSFVTIPALAAGAALPGATAGQTAADAYGQQATQVVVEADREEADGLTLRAHQERLRTVLERLELSAGVRIAYSPERISADRLVTLRAEGAEAEDVLRHLASALELQVLRTSRGQYILVPGGEEAADEAPVQGSVEGRVLRANGTAVAGATVRLAGTDLGAYTDEEGRFRIAGVPPGSYTIRVSMAGLRTASRTIEVSEGETVTVVFDEMRVTAMDEIVVTGTRVQTQRRNLSTSVSVISEQEVEQSNPTSVIDLFENNIAAGVVSLSLGADSDFNQKVLIRGNNTTLSNLVPCVTLLVDGRKTQLRALSAISAQNVARVEVIRGAQAATLYGSDASCGVIQVFTKKGADVEDQSMTVTARFGAIESPYADDTPTEQEYGANLVGSLGEGSYSLSATYRSQGGYVPNYDREFKSASAGFQTSVVEDLRIDVSARFFEKDFGVPGSAGVWYGVYQEGNMPPGMEPDPNDTNAFRTVNIGFSADYAPLDWWSHSITVGLDNTSMEGTSPPDPGAPDDAPIEQSTNDYNLPSVRYTNSLEPEIDGPLSATLTTGLDWENRQWRSLTFSHPDNESPVNVTDPGQVWEDDHTETGIFGQLQVGVGEDLSFNVGLRGDHHSNFGADFGEWSVNPRVGVAYAIDLGEGATLKPRASWGSAISAPGKRMSRGGAFNAVPNPDLRPQKTEGWEIGLDGQFLDGRLHTTATYYDQDTEDAFTVRFIEFPAPFQYVNAGLISNDGAELEVEWNAEKLTAKANFSWVDNEVLAINEEGGSANEVGRPVSRPPIPATSGGLQISYAAGEQFGRASPGAVRLGVSTNWTGRRWALDWGRFWNAQATGTYTGDQSDYTQWFDGFGKANAYVSYRVSDGYSLDLRVDNVFDSLSQPTPDYVVPGRQITVGLKAEL